MDTEELASTENIQPVEVKPVVSTISEQTSSNSKQPSPYPSHPGHFGKLGMKTLREHKNREWCESVNLDKLWTLLSEASQKKYLEDKSKVPTIDVTKAGFMKVLGRGRLPNVPVIVKARFFSDRAQRRIQAVGGSCVLTF